jgi:hypothetical protein
MISIDDNSVNDKNKLQFLLGLVDTLESIIFIKYIKRNQYKDIKE